MILESSGDPAAGRGHALFLGTLTFNELQNGAWKRGKKSKRLQGYPKAARSKAHDIDI